MEVHATLQMLIQERRNAGALKTTLEPTVKISTTGGAGFGRNFILVAEVFLTSFSSKEIESRNGEYRDK